MARAGSGDGSRAEVVVGTHGAEESVDGFVDRAVAADDEDDVVVGAAESSAEILGVARAVREAGAQAQARDLTQAGHDPVEERIRVRG